MSEIDSLLDSGINFIPAVVGVFKQGEKLCYGQRLEVSGGLGEGLISGYGGKRGDRPEISDETDEEAMIREGFEESGAKITNLQDMGRVRFIFPNKPKWNQDVRVYLITEWEGEIVQTAAMKPYWCYESDIPWDKMWDDSRYWEPKILAGEKINAIFLYSEDNKRVKEHRFEETLN